MTNAKKNMVITVTKVTKQLTINLGQYESLRIGVEDAPSFEEADDIIVSELKRISLPVDKKIRQCLQWNETIDEYM